MREKNRRSVQQGEKGKSDKKKRGDRGGKKKVLKGGEKR